MATLVMLRIDPRSPFSKIAIKLHDVSLAQQIDQTKAATCYVNEHTYFAL